MGLIQSIITTELASVASHPAAVFSVAVVAGPLSFLGYRSASR